MELELKYFSEMESKNLSCKNSFIVSEKVFGYPINKFLIHQVVSTYLTNARQGTRSQKNRSEVSGSNRKPWRQKGTGRARSGSVKSPIWRSGGVTFAAKPKKYNNKINKKMYQGAIKSILSSLVCENRLFLITNLFLEFPRTKLFLEQLKKIVPEEKSVLIITDFFNENLMLASRNLHKVKIKETINLDPISLISFDVTFIDNSIVNKIEDQLI